MVNEMDFKEIVLEYLGHKLIFHSDSGLFSPGQVDSGTRAMLSEVNFERDWKVLDLGCGYGVVGVCAATVVGPENVVMTDVNERAVELSRYNFLKNIFVMEARSESSAEKGVCPKRNEAQGQPSAEASQGQIETQGKPAEMELSGDEAWTAPDRDTILSGNIFVSDGLKGIKDRDFDIILSNPPYHTDFCVAKEFIEDGYRALKIGGQMVMVTKRRTWYENKMKSVFGGVRVIEKDGYFVFISEKREKRQKPEQSNGGGMSKKLQKKMKNRVVNHSGRQK